MKVDDTHSFRRERDGSKGEDVSKVPRFRVQESSEIAQT